MKGHPLLIRWPFVLLAAQVSRARRVEGACAVASRSASLTLDTAVPSWEVDSYEEDEAWRRRPRALASRASLPGSDRQRDRDRDDLGDVQAHQCGQAQMLEFIAPLDLEEGDQHDSAEKPDGRETEKQHDRHALGWWTGQVKSWEGSPRPRHVRPPQGPGRRGLRSARDICGMIFCG